MIYLFDDNSHSQMSENYGINYITELPKYKDIITHFPKHSDTEGYAFLDNATAVFIHDSFPNGSDYSNLEHKLRIIAEAKRKKIPYVVFSNSSDFTMTTYDSVIRNSIKTIKKDRFYFNLLNFLNYLKQGKNFKIEVLAIGEYYEKEKALIIRDKLSKFLLQQGENFNYERDIEEGGEYYKLLKELFFFAYSESFEQKFAEFDASAFDNNITSKDFKIFINSLTKEIISKDNE